MLGASLKDIDFNHVAGCKCCGPSKFEATLVDMATVAFAMSVQRVAIDDWLDAPLEEEEKADALEPENDPFLEYELVIASVLAARSADFVADAEEILKKPFYIPVAAQKADYTARIDEAIAAVEQINRLWMQQGLTVEQENSISYALNDALTAGTDMAAASTGSRMPLANTARARMANGMMNAAKYYTNAFFNTQVMPALFKAMELGVGTAGDNLIYKTILGVLHERLRTVPYWRVVANAAASRAYHYGLVKSAQSAGRRFYKFHATLDAKTSETCWALHGREWAIADAVALMERIAEAEPEEVKVIAPWLRYKDIEHLLSNPYGLDSLGVIVPPVHGNCRSTLVII